MDEAKWKGRVTYEQFESVRRIGDTLITAMEALKGRGIPIEFAVDVMLAAVATFGDDVGGREAFVKLAEQAIAGVERGTNVADAIEKALRTPQSEKS